MRVLLLIPDATGFAFTDHDFKRGLERGGGATVYELDPYAVYRESGAAGLEAEVLRQVRQHDIEYLLYWFSGFDFDPSFLCGALAGVYRVLMFGDDEYSFDSCDRYYAQCADLVLSFNPFPERYWQYGVDAQMMPGTYDASVFRPEYSSVKCRDVSFVGTWQNKPGRDAAYDALAAAGVRLELYGRGTPGGILSRDQVIEVYRGSRINLNFTTLGANPMDRHQNINRRLRQVKGRCTKIALCGSFVLSEYAPGLERLFEIGTEIDVFHDVAELAVKVRYYLDNESLRETMAARAHARARREYDEAGYWARTAQFIRERAQHGQRRPYQGRPRYFDPAFWRGYGTWRFRYLPWFLFTGRFGSLTGELVRLIRAGGFSPGASFWLAADGLSHAATHSRAAAAVLAALRGMRRLWRSLRTAGAYTRGTNQQGAS